MLERNLRKLPPRYQSILWMRDVQGMSTREAAELLDMKPTTFKSARYRARLRLGVGSCLASARTQNSSKSRSDRGGNGHRLISGLIAEVEGQKEG